MVPIPATLASLSQPAPIISWGILNDQLTEGNKNGVLVYRWFCTKCKHHPNVDSCSTTTTLCDIPVHQRWLEIFQVAELGAVHLVVHFGRRNGQMCDYILVHELWLRVCWVIRDIEGILLGNWRQGNLWKRYVNISLQTGKNHEDICLS